MSITDVCLKKPVFAWMIMAATVTFGLVALTRIGVSQFPDVDYPNVNISVPWPGASPEDIETSIINNLEESLAQVEGVTSMTSSAQSGRAQITVQFDISRDIDLALQDVQAKVSSSMRSLPIDVQPPSVSKSNPDDQPIMTIGLSGPFPRQLLADIARYTVQERLQTLPGVGQIQTIGYLDRNIRIWVDADKLLATGLTVTDITSALTKQHVNMPGGQLQLEGRQLSVRVLGEAADLDTLRNIILRPAGQGQTAPIYIKDVALVEDGFADVNSVARSNGQTVQGMGILKQRGSNAVAVAAGVRAALTEIQKNLPQGMELSIVFDTTVFIQESVTEIEMELCLALGLTSIVCWLFLGSLSSTMNVVLAIPMSLLGTVAVIYFCHFTLNTFTLLGLSLAVGLVVDDAVMVMENIFRHAEMGKTKFIAASEGTKEITFAALAATLAVIAIFMPVVFMSGIVGKYFFQFGVTLSVAVALSYIEAITLAPARCAQLLKVGHENQGWLVRVVNRLFGGLERFYSWSLRGALRFPWVVLFVGGCVLASSVWAVIQLSAHGEFVPAQDQSRMNVRFSTSVSSSLAETERLMQRAEEFILKRPEVQRAVINSGPGSGNIQLTLVDPKERTLTQQQLGTLIQGEISKYPGVTRCSVSDPSQQMFGGGGSPIQFSVRGPDWGKLAELSEKMRIKLSEPGAPTTGVRSDYTIGLPELQIDPDRGRANDLGITVQDITTTVNSLVAGVAVGKYSTAGRRLDVRLRLLKAQRSRPEDISRLTVRSPSGDLIPLSLLVTQKEKAVLQEINHADRERAVTINANVADGHTQAEALAMIDAMRADYPEFQDGTYRIVLGGQSQQFKDSINSLLFALLLGIGVAYMVLASQFNSFLHPVTVLTILPLSIAGAAFALLIANKTLNIFSMIGVLLLMGIVKKNSIILVDYATALRGEGLDAKEAMQRAGPIRLRPILMTSIATMMAAIPSAMGLGPGSETRAPMADAVIGGLVVSTVLSLLVVPAFYVVADRMKWRLANLFKKKKKDPDIPDAAPEHG